MDWWILAASIALLWLLCFIDGKSKETMVRRDLEPSSINGLPPYCAMKQLSLSVNIAITVRSLRLAIYSLY